MGLVFQNLIFYATVSPISNDLTSAADRLTLLAEAAQIVLDTPVKKTMIPLNVTHTAIVTKGIHTKILSPTDQFEDERDALPPASTPLRHMLSTLLNYFASSYESTFGFMQGPPIHDALTVAYVSRPELFACRRFRVDVELNGNHTAGETVVDMWNYRSCDDSWGPAGKNCVVAESLNVRDDILVQ